LKVKDTDMNRLLIGSMLFAFLLLGGVNSAKSQSANANKAKAYYFQAEKAFGQSNFKAAMNAVLQTEKLLGTENPRTTALKVKIHFAQGNYKKAKHTLDKFYTYKVGDSLAIEMSDYVVQIDEKIDAEDARIRKVKQQAIAKVETDRLAAIAAENKRLRGERLRQQQVERDRVAQLVQKKAAEQQVIKDQLRICESESSTINCFAVAKRHELGRDGYLVDMEQAARYYAKSCRPKGDDIHQGCFGRVRLLSLGHGVSENPDDEIRNIVNEKRRNDGYRGRNLDKVDWNYLSGQSWLKGKKRSAGNSYYKSNSIVASYYFDLSCKAENKTACNAAKQVTPDKLHQAIDMFVNCENDGPLDRGAACYAFAEIFEKDKHIYKYLKGEYPHYAITQYVERQGARINRYYEPDRYYKLACDRFKNPGACFREAEQSYEYANTGRTTIRYWLEEVIQKYESICETKNQTSVDKKMRCDRLDIVKASATQDFEAAKASCLNPIKTSLTEEDCKKVATAYEKGFVFPADSSRLFEYALRTCNVWRRSGCKEAEEFAKNGTVMLPPDFENLAAYYGAACSYYQSPPLSVLCTRAIKMYETGDGVEQDLSTAKTYFKLLLKRHKNYCKSASRGSDECKEYKRLKAEYSAFKSRN
jgi:TPR repeat protein